MAFCNQLQSFQIFSLFGIFLRNYWSDLDQTLIFAYCGALCSQLQSFISFSLFCIFLRNYWSSSNFDLCSCCGILQPIAKFPNFLIFWHFSQELQVWSWSNFNFCSCCGILQPIAKFPNFLTFLHFSHKLLGWSWSNFEFCLWFGSLQSVVKVSTISHIFAFLSGTTGHHQTLIFVYAVALCSQLLKFQQFLSFLHFL